MYNLWLLILQSIKNNERRIYMKKRIANLLLITLYVNILMLCFGTVEVKADGIGTRTYWNGYSFYICI